VFQDYAKALLPWRTVAGNVELALESRRVPRGDGATSSPGCSPRSASPTAPTRFRCKLSGGIAAAPADLARCLAQAPQVLLMDEPFGALDAMTRQTLQDEVARLSAESWHHGRVRDALISKRRSISGDRVIAMESRPAASAKWWTFDLPRPRNSSTSAEDPRFLDAAPSSVQSAADGTLAHGVVARPPTPPRPRESGDPEPAARSLDSRLRGTSGWGL
jgi:NitT/TauT family transport system ATP-binding protein